MEKKAALLRAEAPDHMLIGVQLSVRAQLTCPTQAAEGDCLKSSRVPPESTRFPNESE